MENNTPVKSGLWLLLEYFVRFGVTIFVAVAVARYLGPSNYGELNIVIAVCSIFTVFSTLGIEDLIVKNIIRANSIGKVFYSAFYLKLAGSVVGYIIAIFISIVFDLNVIFILIYGLTIMFKALDITELWLKSKLDGKRISLIKISSFSLVSMLKVMAIVLEYDLFIFILIFTLEHVILGVLYYFIYHKNIKPTVSDEGDLKTVYALLKEGTPLIFSALIIVLSNRIDILMLDLFTDNHEVGIYSAAAKISLIMNVIPLVLCNSIFPKMSEIKKLTISYKQGLFDLNTFVVYLIFIPFFFISGWFIELALGQEYSESIVVLQIHMTSSFFVAMITVRNNILILEGKTKYQLYASLIGLSSNIILNIFLIQLYGAIGAAISTVVSHFIIALIATYAMKSTRIYAFLAIKSFFFFFRVKNLTTLINSFY